MTLQGASVSLAVVPGVVSAFVKQVVLVTTRLLLFAPAGNAFFAE